MSDSRRHFLQNTTLAAAAACLANTSTASAANPPAGKPLDPNSGLAGIQALFQQPDPVIWLITGDSITHGALHTYGWRSYPELFAERVRWELKRVRDIVINTGISGDTTSGTLKDIDWRILQFRPHVVSVMLGMNDCGAGPQGRDAFRKNLTEITRKVQASGAIPLLNTPNTVYIKNSQSRADLPNYAQIVREVAAETKAGLVDHWKHWSEAKPDQEQLLPWIEDKSIHPGVYGHRAFAREIFLALGIYDPNSLTCKLEVP